jgi:hypothetical protein
MQIRTWPAALATFLVVGGMAAYAASTITLGWGPVSHETLAGYRVYYGTTSGEYTESVDVGNVTAATISGLPDCVTQYVAVKAYAENGNESETFSNEISGWPRPSFVNVTRFDDPEKSYLEAPDSGVVQQQLNVYGGNFQSGVSSRIWPEYHGLTVVRTHRSSCSRILITFEIASDIQGGSVAVDVFNPDGVYGPLDFNVMTVVVPVVPNVVREDLLPPVVE